MRMDMTNFVIRNIRPHIQHHLVEYERNKFQEVLEETPSMYNIMCANVQLGSKMRSCASACTCCVTKAKVLDFPVKYICIHFKVDIANLLLLILSQEVCRARVSLPSAPSI